MLPGRFSFATELNLNECLLCIWYEIIIGCTVSESLQMNTTSSCICVVEYSVQVNFYVVNEETN